MDSRYTDLSGSSLIVGAGLSLICAALMLHASAASAQDVTVIRGATLIDGTGAQPQRNTDIVIRGDRIQTVGSGTRVPSNARVIDARGKYVVPGLWDKHFHYKDWFPELVITNGVTSAFVQGGDAWDHAQNEGVAKGKILGPRMFFRERSFAHLGGPERTREIVRRTIRERNPSFIKAYTGATKEEIEVLAEEAHANGLHLEGHIGISARDAIEAGIDGLTHATGISWSTVQPEVLEMLPEWRVIDTGRHRVQWPEIDTWDESETEGPNPDISEYWLFLEDPRRLMMFGMMDRGMASDLIDLMVEEEVWFESNLTYMFRHIHDRMEQYRAEDHLILNDRNLHYIDERVRVNVLDYTLLDKVNDEELALMKKGYRNFQWFTKTLIERGGRVIVGPDTTSINHATMLPGVATRRELQLLVDAGVPPMKVIQAATLWPAETVSQDDNLGTVEEGKLADLLILPRNPLDDITAFKDIELVMQNGRILDHGYHYDYHNPIPWPAGNVISFARMGFGPFSEIPTITTGISPAVVVEGSGDVTISVEGERFISSSTIVFDGKWLETEFVNTEELRATVPAHLIQNVGTYRVDVTHRDPGYGQTNEQWLIVKFK